MPRRGYKPTDEHRRKLSASRKGKHFSEEHRRKISDVNKGKKLSENTRRKIAKSLIGNIPWNKGIPHSIETKKKIREHHADISGKNHPNWKGGKSFEPYSVNWTETLRQSIRERDHYTCQMPGCHKHQGDIAHAVHHIDYDKKNCSPDNLLTLCTSCHLKTNYNREYWMGLFKNR